MQKILFLGNGVNRLTNSGMSWNDVITYLANEVHGEDLLKYKDDIPFTLIYDGFSSTSLVNSQRGITPLKKRVAELLNKMKANPFHRKIMELGINHIITTNYDYSLENSATNGLKRQFYRTEKRYSIFRRIKVGNTNIWHIHGEIDKPETITLGHEQYSGQLENLRKYLTKKTSALKQNPNGFETSNPRYSWGDLFLRDEIHIVGFSLDFSEIDMWWLLSFKAQYKARYNFECGPTFFYYWSSDSKNEKDVAKISLLKSLKVKVFEEFNIIDYKEMYKNFINGFCSTKS